MRNAKGPGLSAPGVTVRILIALDSDLAFDLGQLVASHRQVRLLPVKRDVQKQALVALEYPDQVVLSI